MTKYGTGYETERAKFKALCMAESRKCVHCHDERGPIDYVSRYNPKRYNPLLFSLEHMQPVSLGHDAMDQTKWQASHLVCNVKRGNTTRGQFPTSRQW